MEFSLSDKIEETRMSAIKTMGTKNKNILSLINTYDFAIKTDIREFIKILKEEMQEGSVFYNEHEVVDFNWIIKTIDKFIGNINGN